MRGAEGYRWWSVGGGRTSERQPSHAPRRHGAGSSQQRQHPSPPRGCEDTLQSKLLSSFRASTPNSQRTLVNIQYNPALPTIVQLNLWDVRIAQTARRPCLHEINHFCADAADSCVAATDRSDLLLHRVNKGSVYRAQEDTVYRGQEDTRNPSWGWYGANRVASDRVRLTGLSTIVQLNL